jgi:hypothetical protein
MFMTLLRKAISIGHLTHALPKEISSGGFPLTVTVSFKRGFSAGRCARRMHRRDLINSVRAESILRIFLRHGGVNCLRRSGQLVSILNTDFSS